MNELNWDEIVSIEELDEEECYDITLLEKNVYLNEPNFICDKIVVHNCGMHDTYIKRKKSEEAYSLHPLLEKVLGKTYGVMVFQEQIMKVLNVVGEIPLIHCEKIRKAISKKKEKDIIKYKEMFIENGQKNLSCTLEYINNLWEQVVAFSGYGFNASHAYGYAYIAARQLKLKAYYPLEFYCSVLACEGSQEKIKEYKIDAKKHGIDIMGVDINKSKEDFHIHEDGKIYFGFSKIKGIGSDIAKKIVENQPYESFPDFLNRFGTESKVIKPLVALGVFNDPYDKVTLYKFYEYFKDKQASEKTRQKRFEASLISYQTQLEALLEQYLPDTSILNELNKFDDKDVQERWKNLFEFGFMEERVKYKDQIKIKKTSVYKKFITLVEKRNKSIQKNTEKINEPLLKIADFNSYNYILEKSIEDLLKNDKLAESEFYGFNWIHDLEESPHYTGLTFSDFEESQKPVGPVEVMVRKNPIKKTSQKGNTYWTMEVEDATGQIGWITIWEDDYIRFSDYFKSNNLLRIWINPPFGNFKSYNLQSPKKHERARILPKNKEDDKRVFVMERKKKQIIVNVREEEFDIL